MSGKWAFSCGKKWHRPNPDIPEERYEYNKKLYVGRVCGECGCIYLSPEGKVSPILDPGGGIIG